MSKTYVVTRFVARDAPHNFSGRDVQEGETLHLWGGHTYGCIDSRGGLPMSEQPGKHPFFEFPEDALKEQI